MDAGDSTLHKIFQIARSITKDLNRVLEPYGISGSEWSLIRVLDKNGPQTQAALADYLKIEPPAISRCLARIEQKGLIIRSTGDDRREKLVKLSETALSSLPCWRNTVTEHRHRVMSGLSSDQCMTLDKMLAAILLEMRQ